MNNLTDDEIIKKLETQFGRDLTYITPAPELFNSKYHKGGDRIFRCLDIEAEAVVSVDVDGYVTSKAVHSKFSDVLGVIK